MSSSASSPFPKGLPVFSSFVAGAVVFLITIGSQVTSLNAGMSVPDWPTTYGYNMFAYPFHEWVGPRFWEHTHRLVASGVGFLTVILAGWIWLKESRPWVRRLAIFAVGLVILQGVVGGVRVLRAQQDYGIIHGTLGQLFLVTTGIIALAYTRNWVTYPANGARLPKGWEQAVGLVTGLVFCQLVLGAVMRHQHAGLSIPDFPTVYGHYLPQVTGADVAAINEHRRIAGQEPTSLVQIYLQVAHRAMAFTIFCGIIAAALAIFRCKQSPARLRLLSGFWVTLVSIQVCLGMTVIWTQKNAFVTTAHVVTGALILLVGSHLTALIVHWRRMEAGR